MYYIVIIYLEFKFKLIMEGIAMINKIPQSELEVMKVIWENEEPVSSKIVTTKLEEVKGWKRTSVGNRSDGAWN